MSKDKYGTYPLIQSLKKSTITYVDVNAITPEKHGQTVRDQPKNDVISPMYPIIPTGLATRSIAHKSQQGKVLLSGRPTSILHCSGASYCQC